MNLIKTINDYLVVYNEHERLWKELQEKPVVYFADYKVQEIMLPSGSYKLMIYKFNPGSRDFHKFCDIKVNEYSQERNVIHIVDKQGDTVILSFLYNNERIINSINNFHGLIKNTSTKDELFNISMGYQIDYSYEEIMEFFRLTKNINKNSWIYEQ